MHLPSPSIICAAIAFGVLGSAKGLDEGLIATTVNLPSSIHQYDLEGKHLSGSEAANRVSTITSMVHLGSLPRAVIAYLGGDRIGPLWTMRQLCLLWIIGVIIVITSAGSRATLIAGRLIMGVGIGQAGIISPTYLAEVASARHRGLLVCIFAASEYVGIVLGYFAGYGASIHQSDHSSRQWILPQAMQLIMAGLLLLASLGCVDSRRYLCKAGRSEQAVHALCRLRRLARNDCRVADEMQLIRGLTGQHQRLAFFEPWKRLFGQSANRSRMIFLLSAQILGQWSGTNAITTYAPKFFSLLGITSNSESLLTTAIFGLVKLVAALICAIFFIDRVGRKRTLVSGITIQLAALLYVAIYLTVLSYNSGSNDSAAAIVAVIAVYITGIGYAFGWNSVQYLLNAEILPSSVRTLGTSLLMCFHYANRFALTKAVPSMMLDNAFQPKGKFWFFAGVALLGVLGTAILLPETGRRELEEAGDTLQVSPGHQS